MLALILMLAAGGGSAPEPPAAYSLEERLYSAAGGNPDALIKVYVSGDRVRSETVIKGAVARAAIVRPDRGVVYLIDEARRTYQEATAGGWPAFRTLKHYQEEARSGRLKLTRAGSETVRGETCDKYVGIDAQTETAFRLWISAKTGLPVMWAPEQDGETDARIEWSSPAVGPQPDVLFEPPAGYTRSR